MKVLYECCAGLDVHHMTVVACLRVQKAASSADKTVRTFAATTPGLLQLHDWLLEGGCSHVAMESTGIYWKPVFNLLETSFEILLVNARHIKAVPGRKTDVKDCEWIADLLAHGLLRASFIPPAPIRDLRDLTRYRKTLIRSRATEVNRIQKLLETANIKLGGVATDVLGVSGRAMLRSLMAGEQRGDTLADLAKGTLRKKRSELADALTGRFTPHHAFLLEQMLVHLEYLESSIDACDRRIEGLTRPFQAVLARLLTIPGVGHRSAEVLISELGVDMRRFPTPGHLASWARLCPGNEESAGKRHDGRTGQGNAWLRTALVEAAWCTTRHRNTYLAAQFHRIARRRGKRKAVIAVAHSILVAIHHMLGEQLDYQDLGADYFDRLNVARLRRYHTRRLEELGFQVTVQEPRVA